MLTMNQSKVKLLQYILAPEKVNSKHKRYAVSYSWKDAQMGGN